MNLSSKLQLQQTKILKTGQFYDIILEYKNYRIKKVIPPKGPVEIAAATWKRSPLDNARQPQ